MNLIEELGLEKCRQIVDGAPDWAVNFCLSDDIDDMPYTDELEGSCDYCVDLNDLRAAIADHDRTDYVSDIRNHIAPTTKVIER